MRIQNLISEASTPGAVPKWWWRPDQGFVELIAPHVHHFDPIFKDRTRFGIARDDYQEVIDQHAGDADPRNAAGWPMVGLALDQGWVRVGANRVGIVYMQARSSRTIYQCAREFSKQHPIMQLTIEARDPEWVGEGVTLKGDDLELFLRRGVVRVTEEQALTEIVIKLGGFGPKQADPELVQRVKQASDAFMTQWNMQTRANPLDPRERIVGNNRALVTLRPFGQSIHLSSIRTFKPKSGGGTEGMELIKQIADRTGATISGTVKAFKIDGMQTPSTARLAQWYRSLGFDVDQDGDLSYTPVQANPGLNEMASYMAAWILPDGEVLTGFRHEKMAADYFKAHPEEGEMTNRASAFQMGWIRVLLVGSTFGAEYDKAPNRQQWDLLRMMIRDSSATEYCINPRGQVTPNHTVLMQRDALKLIGGQIAQAA